MNWEELKRQIYLEDGSLRDIYMFGTSSNDWEKWVNLVNEKYEVEFFDEKTNSKKDKIDFSVVQDYWSDSGRGLVSATVKVGTVNVQCLFFDNCEIENDIDPKEFRSLEDHRNLIGYLRD